MPTPQTRNKLLISGVLSLANLALIGGIAFAAMISTPAFAQSGSTEPQAKPKYTNSCPSGWNDKGGTGMCYPQQNARPIYPAGSYTQECPSGFGNYNGWCVQGRDTQWTDSARGAVTKANLADRCPIAYFTNPEAPKNCISEIASPPTARLKGAGACRTGEVEDWGLYCVSNYANLTRGETTYGTRDWNAIYFANNGKGPLQADLPEGTEYTPAYITIFGRVKPDGSPMGSSAAASSGSSSSSSSADASGSTPNPCGSASGAAIGGSIAGEAGAALGSMLGGIGKKKKKGC